MISRSVLFVWPVQTSSLQLHIHGDGRLEQSRNGAARLGCVRDGQDFGLVRAGDLRRHVQMRFRNGETRVSFVHRDGRRRVDGFRGDIRLAQFRRERH